MSATEAPKLSVAVIGGGWAGCAAAVTLADAGHAVTLYEAARTLGGRARAVDAHGRRLDNGQHIMLGAYDVTLGLLRRVGVAPRDALLRLPLQMRFPPNQGLLDFVAPRLPAPLHMLAALLRAKGLRREDKMALARFSTSARWMGWQLYDDCSVAELLERFGQTERLTRLLWRPLCLAALNTAPEHASSQVFLAVLRDSLGAKRAASDMLLPRLLLDVLFPDAARKHIEGRGGRVLTGTRVERRLRQVRRRGDRHRALAGSRPAAAAARQRGAGGAAGRLRLRADLHGLPAIRPRAAPAAGVLRAAG